MCHTDSFFATGCLKAITTHSESESKQKDKGIEDGHFADFIRSSEANVKRLTQGKTTNKVTPSKKKTKN